MFPDRHVERLETYAFVQASVRHDAQLWGTLCGHVEVTRDDVCVVQSATIHVTEHELTSFRREHLLADLNGVSLVISIVNVELKADLAEPPLPRSGLALPPPRASVRSVLGRHAAFRATPRIIFARFRLKRGIFCSAADTENGAVSAVQRQDGS